MDWRTDRLTNWQIDGLTNWKTEKLKNWQTDQLTKKIRKHFSKIHETVFEKNGMVRLNFQYHFINLGEILNKMLMFKYLSTEIQIAYFPRQFYFEAK